MDSYDPTTLNILGQQQGQFAPLGSTLGTVQPLTQGLSQAAPFTWGQGGVQLTPDQLALRQKIALQNMQGDYSPIRSPWQGLARVAQNVEGALDERSLEKQQTQMLNARQQAAAALAGGNATAIPTSTVAAALASPDPEIQKIGQLVWKQQNPDPMKNDTVNDYNFRLQTLGKAAADAALARTGDPIVTTTLPNGVFYSGPQSGLGAALQAGGGQAPAATVPATLPADFDFDKGGPTQPASATFPDPMKAPGTMTSGRRTVEGNRAVGGVPNSHHLSGDAADYTGASLAQLEAYFGPKARYLDEGNHVHVTLPGYGAMPFYGRNGTVGM